MLARLPEVDSMLDRALTLDESWGEGSLHEFAIRLASARPGKADYQTLKKHFDSALALSRYPRAGLYVAYAEAVSLPQQDKPKFRALLEKALILDPDTDPSKRLVNVLAQRRALRLLTKIDDLILDLETDKRPEGAQ